MTKKDFSQKILNSSYSMWRAVLAGDRNLSYKKAQLVSQLFVTPLDVWLDPGRKNDRKAAWEKFIKR